MLDEHWVLERIEVGDKAGERDESRDGVKGLVPVIVEDKHNDKEDVGVAAVEGERAEEGEVD